MSNMDAYMIRPRDPAAAAAAQIAGLSRRVATLEAGGGRIGSLDGGVISDGTITASSISTGSLQADLVLADFLNAGTISTQYIVAAAADIDKLQATHISAGSINAGHLDVGTVQAGTVTTTLLNAGTIETKYIVASAASIDKLQAGHINAGSIDAAFVNATAIQATTVNTTTITAVLATANVAMSDAILARTIAATNITTNGLSAISANLGTINAGTITGATIRTSASNPKVQTDSTGVFAMDAAGVVTFKADAVTGKIITLTGIGGPNSLYNSAFGAQALAYTRSGGTYGWVTQGGSWGIVTIPSNERPLPSVIYAARTATLNAVNSIDNVENGTYMPCRPGDTYTLSFYMRGVTDATATGVARILWRDSGGSTLLTSESAVTTAPFGAGWTRVSVAATAPALTTNIRPVIRITTSPTTHVEVTAGQLENGQLQTAFAVRPDEILPGTVKGGNVTGAEIQAGTIIFSDLLANTITADRLNGASIYAIESTIGNARIGKLRAGSVDAASINVGTLTSVTVPNSNFAAVSAAGVVPVDGSVLGNGWTPLSGTWTVQSDAAWGRIGQALGIGGTTCQQTIDLPVGRHIFRCWVKAAAGGTGMAFIHGTVGTATATLDPAAGVSGAAPGTGWVLSEVAVTVTVAGTFNLWLRNTLSTATAQFANLTCETSVTGTSITPASISTTHIAASSITADKINFRVGGRNRLPSSSFEDGSTGGLASAWGDETRANSAAQAKTGTKSLLVTPTVSRATNGVFIANHGVTSGRAYTWSFWVYSTSSQPFVCEIRDTPSNVGTLTTVTIPASTWTRLSVTRTIASGSAAHLLAYWQNVTTAAFYIDDFQMEEGDVLTDWTPYINPTVIDGSTITGATVQTGLSGTNRLVLSGTTLDAYNAANALMMSLDPATGLILRGTSAANAVSGSLINWKDSSGNTHGQIYLTDTSGGTNLYQHSVGYPNQWFFLNAQHFSTTSSPSNFIRLDHTPAGAGTGRRGRLTIGTGDSTGEVGSNTGPVIDVSVWNDAGTKKATRLLDVNGYMITSERIYFGNTSNPFLRADSTAQLRLISSATSISLDMHYTSGQAGRIYGDSSGFGILNGANQWAVRSNGSVGATNTSIKFYTSGTEYMDLNAGNLSGNWFIQASGSNNNYHYGKGRFAENYDVGNDFHDTPMVLGRTDRNYITTDQAQWPTGDWQRSIHFNAADASGLSWHDSGSRVDQVGMWNGFIVGDSVGWGTINTIGNTASYYTFAARSDERLKTVLGDAQPVLAKIRKVKPKQYKLDQVPGEQQRQGTELDDGGNLIIWDVEDEPVQSVVGILAQDLESEFPEAVDEDPYGHKTVDLLQMIAILWASNNELAAEVDKIKVKVK